jgi:hypothetical protein
VTVVSSGITVSGGGSYAVASDDLYADAQALDAAHDDARAIGTSLARIDERLDERLLRRVGAPAGVFEAERELDRARTLLDEAGSRARVIAVLLRASAEGYGRAEHAAENVARELAARLGYGVGFLLPFLVTLVVPALPAVLAAAVIAGITFPGGVRAIPGSLGRWLGDNNRLLTNPLTVSLVRYSVMSIDDVLMGALHLPPGVERALGDEGLGLVGLDTSAASIVTTASLAGYLVETPVATRVTARTAGIAPPASLAERIDRLPQRIGTADGSPTGEHVVIERYSFPDGPDRFEVYITGTADFSPRSGEEAFDLTSDVTGMAGLPAGAIEAVRQAMRDAGVTADSPVQFSGFSQGGLIAAALASSGEYSTHGVFTAGAPTAHLEVPEGIPVIELEHTDDIVPALGGVRTDTTALVVEREAFAGRETPDGKAVPSHDRGEYRRTAELADAASSERLSAAAAELRGFGAGATSVVSTSYVAQRVRG